jgi:hypothetical protein
MRIVPIFVLALGTTLIVNQAIAENSDSNSSMPDRAELEAAKMVNSPVDQITKAISTTDEMLS